MECSIHVNPAYAFVFAVLQSQPHHRQSVSRNLCEHGSGLLRWIPQSCGSSHTSSYIMPCQRLHSAVAQFNLRTASQISQKNHELRMHVQFTTSRSSTEAICLPLAAKDLEAALEIAKAWVMVLVSGAQFLEGSVCMQFNFRWGYLLVGSL